MFTELNLYLLAGCLLVLCSVFIVIRHYYELHFYIHRVRHGKKVSEGVCLFVEIRCFMRDQAATLPQNVVRLDLV